MVVTAHFLDCDWKLHKRIINFTKITSHNGEEIGKMVEVCLREWTKAFVHFLKKFYDATLELSASKSPTSQLIYQSLIALQVEIERKRLDDLDPTLKKVAHAMKNENRYPIISMIAKDIFAIPSSTVTSEASFSLGKRVVDPFRSCLSPKMVEALVCTRDWLRDEEFSFWKDPTDDDLELYDEIEEIKKVRVFLSKFKCI
ncbi:hypothetical protein F511_09127 [Dorcoceras hygrometricum]|uniref:HAT C-terminal dimerisation domain-containing protein n=1 Tax=Dorcoceras hygrometricum TaxID=472368 RepID=A0A2Z7AVX2_9LAMI|nr:hypothetical protein F511_09127 [Dorcoceras hygrometricum]